MAGKSLYSDADRAAVFVALTTHEGNVKRTARETGVAETTVRRWKKEFEENPPDLGDIQAAAEEFIDAAVRVRDKALLEIERQIEAHELKGAALVTTVGVLDDKITRAKGLADRRVEHVHQLPSPDEIRAALEGVVQGAISAARQREAELVDAEIVEQADIKALPPA